MRYFITLTLIFHTIILIAQRWSGDTSLFQFESQTINLNDSIENTSAIFTPLTNSHNTSWTFTISLDFAPSSSNQLIVYLASDTNSIKYINRGIYLQLGESGNDDAIELYYTDNNTKTLLLRSKDIFSTLIDSLTVQVNHTSNNTWELHTKPKSDSSFTNQGSAAFETTLNTKYFGYSCTYTKTRATLFELSHPLITRFEEDFVAPQINSIIYDETGKTTIQTSEPILLEHITISVNKIIQNNIYKLSDTEYQFPYPNNQNDLEIVIANIIDLENNRGKDTSLLYHKIGFKDLTFTEILFDPNEEQGEFVEVYNPTDYPIDLSKITIARKTNGLEYEQLIDLPPHILEPNTYIALTKYNNWYSPPINSIDLNIPNLINDGATLFLLNPTLEIVDSVTYSDELHSPFLKETKGISLIKNDKWISSSTPTPGTKNYTSNLSHNEIVFSPQLVDLVRNPNEQITLKYNLEIEASANLFLLDRNGNLISQLINTKYIGTAGELFFNLESITSKITTGVYVLLFEFWDLEGNKTIEKNVITIVKH